MTLEPNPSLPASPPARRPRRVHARVALALMETIRTQDLPPELLDDENVSVTIPRRFGLSGVVDVQIRRYREQAGRRGRIPESEFVDLVRFVVRRPDADEVFLASGRALLGGERTPGWRRVLPRRAQFALARRMASRRLRTLFGGRLVRSVGSPFQVEDVQDLLITADPGGDACQLVVGLSRSVLEAYGIESPDVLHSECRARGDTRCLWTAGD